MVWHDFERQSVIFLINWQKRTKTANRLPPQIVKEDMKPARHERTNLLLSINKSQIKMSGRIVRRRQYCWFDPNDHLIKTLACNVISPIYTSINFILGNRQTSWIIVRKVRTVVQCRLCRWRKYICENRSDFFHAICTIIILVWNKQIFRSLVSYNM